MEFRLLGPVEVRDGDARVALGGPKRRAVLAVMLLNANRVVPVDRLIDVVWGESAPATATAQVQAAVSALRRALGNEGVDGSAGERIVTRSPGYLIRLLPDELDLALFERDADAARRALAEGDVEQAAAGLRAALDWWRGSALSDLADSPMQTLAVGLQERRMATLEERIEADLALGRHAAVIPELTELVADHPLRERLRGHLMLALYRSGRQADALAVYRDTRHVLVRDLGLEPGQELQQLERALLSADPALDLRAAVTAARPGSGTRPPCPYRGLLPFGEGDEGVFFGRRTEIAELVARLHAPGPVTVIGPSGCGKSSLIFAGVLPELQRGAAPGPTVAGFRPSGARNVYTGLAAALMPTLEPDLPQADQLPEVAGIAHELEVGGLADVVRRALARSGAGELLLVIDQAEELLAQHPKQVDRFAEQVFGPGAPPELKVVVTLRADFLDVALRHPGLSAALRQSVYTLGAMTAEQLGEVVTGPVAGTGVELQEGLAERIRADVGTDAGALPLLGLTLTLLWERQVDGRLTHDAYEALGRVAGSLARFADEAWRRHSLADDENTARGLFTQLIWETTGGGITRRVASSDDLGDRRWELARRLATSRLLVTGRDAEGRETVELAHEALVPAWSRLRRWIEADREFRQWQEGLRTDIARWERAERDPGLLARGPALTDAQRWSSGRSGDLSPAELDFIARAGRHRRAVTRRRTLLRSGSALGVVMMLVLGSLFVYQRGVSRRASADATSRALAAASADSAGRDPVYSALLALAAYRAQDTAEATAALFRPYLESQGVTSVFSNPHAGLSDVHVSRDGRVLAGVSDNKTVTVWTRAPGQQQRRITSPVLEDDFAPVALAGDGSAVWLVDDGWLIRLQVSDGELRRVMPVGPSSPRQLAVSADGSTVVVVLDAPGERRALRWDTRTGRASAEQALPTGGELREVTVGPNTGSLVVSLSVRDGAGRLSETLEVWGPGELTRRVVVENVDRVVVTPDGAVAVTCAPSSPTVTRLTALRLTDGAEIGRAEHPSGACLEYAVDQTGLTAVQEEASPSAAIMDLRTGTTVSRLRAPLLDDSAARSVPVLAGSGDDLHLAVWNDAHVALLRVPPAGAVLPELAYGWVSSDGRTIGGVVGNGFELRTYPRDGTAPVATVRRPAPYWPSGPANLAVNPRDTLVADRVAVDRVVVRRLPGLEPVREITTPPVPSSSVDSGEAERTSAMFFDRSDRLITVVGHQVDRWDVPSGERLAHLDLVELGYATPDQIVRLTATPEADELGLVVEGRADVMTLDARSGQRVGTIPVGPDVKVALFHGRGPQVLIVRFGGAAELWDSDQQRRVLGPLVADSEFGRRVGLLDEPGHFVVADPGRYQIWHGGSPGPELSVQLDELQTISSASGDGRTVILRGSGEELIGVLRLEPAIWREGICSVIGRRELTDDERAGLPSSTPDQPLCP